MSDASKAPKEQAVSKDQLVKDCRDQLNLVLGFFSRVDAKASVVLAVNSGMLAVLASNTPPINKVSYLSMGIAVLTVILIGISLWFLYRTAFPALEGGHESLIYFREIAKRTESQFIEKYLAEESSVRARDLLGQVWRNSEILTLKFDGLKKSFIFMALALVPWASAAAIFATENVNARSLLLR